MPSYTPTGFSPKNWEDSPSTNTPISAAALEDAETRVTDYAEQEVAIVGGALDDHGDLLTGTHGIVRLRKTVDEVRNNQADLSQSYADDDHLSFAVGANEVWDVDLRLRYRAANATPDMKISFDVPSGGLFEWGPEIYQGSGEAYWVPDNGASGSDALLTTGSLNVNIGTLATILHLHLHGTYIGGASAGTFQTQWAQNSAHASNTEWLANSLLIAHRVA